MSQPDVRDPLAGTALARFHALDRKLDLQITTSHQPVDFNREDVDACIHSDVGPPPNARFHRLFGETLLPVCSPRLVSREPGLATPCGLAQHVLVSSMHRPRDWPTWLGAAGLTDIDASNGIRVENSPLAYQAAIDGVGVVIAQRGFVEEDLANGRLVAPLGLEVPGDGSYYFGYPAERPKSDRVAAFEEWVVREAIRMEEQHAA
jgi:LysR family transcriptional regulator, glycine cleavage system transcriptional activator